MPREQRSTPARGAALPHLVKVFNQEGLRCCAGLILLKQLPDVLTCRPSHDLHCTLHSPHRAAPTHVPQQASPAVLPSPSIFCMSAMASASRRCFSSLLTPQLGVMSPTMAAQQRGVRQCSPLAATVSGQALPHQLQLPETQPLTFGDIMHN